MNVLVVGGGGRESALVHTISKSRKVTKIFCAPGNAGIAQRAETVPIAVDQIEALLQFAQENQIDLTVVGPELPLSLGIVDRFLRAGLAIFGPTAKAAQIETSKRFSKQFMQKYHIPTPEAGVMPIAEARDRIRTMDMPVVLKQDGLAAGKGVCIIQNVQEADAVLDEFQGRGETLVLLEQYLTGTEATFFVLADGDYGVPFSTAQDYKRLLEGDGGPNTGGMGAISPSPAITPEMTHAIISTIVNPTLQGMVKEGIPYTGILYVGLMLTAEGPFVLEFNARLGDPEAQSVLPRLKTDFIEVMEVVRAHQLNRLHLEWHDEVAVSVVLASEGYPGKVKTGDRILGLDQIDPHVLLSHAGIVQRHDQYLTQGGRVLSVTALGRDSKEARERVYRAVDQVSFRGMQYRRDIGSPWLHSPYRVTPTI